MIGRVPLHRISAVISSFALDAIHNIAHIGLIDSLLGPSRGQLPTDQRRTDLDSLSIVNLTSNILILLDRPGHG